MQKTTHLLLVLIAITLSFSLIRRNYFFVGAQARGQTPTPQQDAKAERYEQAKRNFPTVDYEEPDLPDTEENRTKQEKKKRFNNLMKWVSVTPQWYIAENLAMPEGLFNFPALPVAKSDIVLIGVVGETKAHLSENKRNVFSEFKIAVETVLKTSNEQTKQGSVLTIDRMGGFVTYPNGQKILYRISGMYMPKVGARYLFFLNSINKHDYGIVTAYELTPAGVIPLDMSSQFLVLEGKSENDIMQELRRLLLNTSN
jgi:hypothetical protein